MHLLMLIERHLRQSGMAPTRLGREAVNDPRFVFDLRNGRQPGPRITGRAAMWLAEHAGERG